MRHNIRRRRSPGWIRRMPSEDLHALAGRFQRDRQMYNLTDGQEWLWDAIISELEYRHRSMRPCWQRCSCQFCVPPFVAE